MNKLSLKFAVFSALGLASAHVSATGFVNLPATGFAISSGTSAYTLCNTTGDFGSGISSKPTSGANNTCAVFPSIEVTAPETGFTLIGSASRPAVMNNTYTGNTDKTVGTVTEYVWRKQTGNNYECIYGTKVNMNSTDYNTGVAGYQYFEVNDIARGGFSGLPVDVAYSTISTVADVVFRTGRTYTSVQHRSAGYSALPLTGLGANPSINGLNSSGTANATQQLADVNSNWVDFTTEVVWLDYDEAELKPVSPMLYVKTTCSAAAPSTSVADDAIRLRQTSQSGEGFIEIPVRGFIPPGGSISPAHTDPY